MEPSIRLMHPEQKEEVLTLMKSCFPKSSHHRFFIHPDSTLIAKQGDTVIGGINLEIFNVKTHLKAGHLGWLYVKEDQRGRNLGFQLVSEAVEFLRLRGCTDITASVDGDNSGAINSLTRANLSAMPMRKQIMRFGPAGCIKVNHKACRYLDVGMFLYHLSLPENIPAPEETQRALFTTAALGIIAWSFSVLGFNLPHLLNPSLMPSAHGDPLFQNYPVFVMLFPLFTIALRSIAQLLSAHVQGAGVSYKGWDTAWVMGFGIPFLTGIPFPVPGGVYLSGTHWHSSDMSGVLCNMAKSSQLAEAFLCVFFRHTILIRYCYPLLVLDTVCAFVPFLGFGAHRVCRHGMINFVIPVFTLFVTTVLVL